jgi:hypothetical protein
MLGLIKPLFDFFYGCAMACIVNLHPSGMDTPICGISRGPIVLLEYWFFTGMRRIKPAVGVAS